MISLLDINNTFFTLMGYPMSYLEFFGTILNIVCVWLAARNKILNWPVGIIATFLFAILFLQINLYADFFEQVYFLFTGFWGWYAWSVGRNSPTLEKPITTLRTSTRSIWIAAIALGTLALGLFTANVHAYLPQFFTEPASFPFLDAFTTVMSFVAQILLIRKNIESWILWIIVDVIGIWLYWAKDVKLVSLLYVIFLILAAKGLISWIKNYQKQTN